MNITTERFAKGTLDRVMALSGLAAIAVLLGGNYPVLVGQRKAAFPRDACAQLELLEEHRFGNGVVNLRYRTLS